MKNSICPATKLFTTKLRTNWAESTHFGIERVEAVADHLPTPLSDCCCEVVVVEEVLAKQQREADEFEVSRDFSVANWKKYSEYSNSNWARRGGFIILFTLLVLGAQANVYLS